MSSKLNAGEVTLTFADDDVVTLKPTIKAVLAINRQFGNLRAANTAITNIDIDAIVFVVRVGAGLSDKEARDLPERVWRADVIELVQPISEYLHKLIRGGRAPGEDAEGNAASP